jgi:hypothetical protein
LSTSTVDKQRARLVIKHSPARPLLALVVIKRIRERESLTLEKAAAPVAA